MTEIRTKFLFRLALDVGAHHVVGPTPFGSRRVAPIAGGTFEGPELSGIVINALVYMQNDPVQFSTDIRLTDRIMVRLHATARFVELTNRAVAGLCGQYPDGSSRVAD